MFKLRFSIGRLTIHSKDYNYNKPDLENEILMSMNKEVAKKGYLTKEQFIKVCSWKTHRTKSLCNKNDEQIIKDITFIALNHKNEKLRIEILTLLEGVSWPTASVFLHFFHKDNYPILDFRAVWSLGINSPPLQYDFNFWWEYVLYCRELSRKSKLNMREVDRALWSYSNKYQERYSTKLL